MDKLTQIALKNKDLVNGHFLKQYNMSITLKNKIKNYVIELEKIYGQPDFRTDLIAIPFNSIVMQIFYYKSYVYTFYNHSWWQDIKIAKHGRNRFARKSENFFNFLNFIHFFSYVESGLRQLIKKYRPGSCKDGKGLFSRIYDNLLTDLNLTKYKETFVFASSIRNSIHNNGVYRPTYSQDDKIVVFRSKKYKFEYNQPIGFFLPELAVEIEDEIFDCLIEIVNHEEIKNL